MEQTEKLKKVTADRHQHIVSDWFCELGKKGRIKKFYEIYYTDVEGPLKPSYDWVYRVIKDLKPDERFGIWLNAYDHYVKEMGDERKLAEIGAYIEELNNPPKQVVGS